MPKHGKKRIDQTTSSRRTAKQIFANIQLNLFTDNDYSYNKYDEWIINAINRKMPHDKEAFDTFFFEKVQPLFPANLSSSWWISIVLALARLEASNDELIPFLKELNRHKRFYLSTKERGYELMECFEELLSVHSSLERIQLIREIYVANQIAISNQEKNSVKAKSSGKASVFFNFFCHPKKTTVIDTPATPATSAESTGDIPPTPKASSDSYVNIICKVLPLLHPYSHADRIHFICKMLKLDLDHLKAMGEALKSVSYFFTDSNFNCKIHNTLLLALLEKPASSIEATCRSLTDASQKFYGNGLGEILTNLVTLPPKGIIEVTQLVIAQASTKRFDLLECVQAKVKYWKAGHANDQDVDCDNFMSSSSSL